MNNSEKKLRPFRYSGSSRTGSSGNDSVDDLQQEIIANIKKNNGNKQSEIVKKVGAERENDTNKGFRNGASLGAKAKLSELRDSSNGAENGSDQPGETKDALPERPESNENELPERPGGSAELPPRPEADSGEDQSEPADQEMSPHQPEQFGDISKIIEVGDPVLLDGVSAELDHNSSFFLDSISDGAFDTDIRLIYKDLAGNEVGDEFVNWEDITPRYDSALEYTAALNDLQGGYEEAKAAGNEPYQPHLVKLILQVRHFAQIFYHQAKQSAKEDTKEKEAIRQLRQAIAEAGDILVAEGLLATQEVKETTGLSDELPLPDSDQQYQEQSAENTTPVTLEELTDVIKPGDPVFYLGDNPPDGDLLSDGVWRLESVVDGRPRIFYDTVDGEKSEQSKLTEWGEIVPTFSDMKAYTEALKQLRKLHETAQEDDDPVREEATIDLLLQVRHFARKFRQKYQQES